MKFSSFSMMCFAGLVGAQAVWSADDKPEAPSPEKPTRAALRDKQYDVSLDARDIERILTRLKRASELSKQRMTEAAEAAEGVSGAIERGDANMARQRAEETSKMFQEIAKQLEALLTEETPQRVAAARNLAAQLARAEQQFAQQAKVMSKQMQNAETQPGQSQGNDKKDPDKKPMGQGGAQPKEPQENPSGSGKPNSPMDDEEKPSGEENKKTEGQGSSKDSKEPMPNGAGVGDPMEKPDAENPDGKGGDEKKDETKSPAGIGGGKPQKDKNENGGGGGDDEKDPKDDKNPSAGGGRQKLPMTPEERREQLAGRATELANRAATLLDILDAIAASDDPADKDAAAKVTALLKETDLKNAVEAMQAAANQVLNQKLEDAQATALDVSERLQITTQRLDAVYRAIVGPQAEELRKLEQQLLQLQQKLEDLQTPAQIAAWHRAVQELLNKAEELGISETRRNELLDEMKKQGFSVDGVRMNFDWALTDGRYAAPATYAPRLIAVQEEIQSRIQNLLLGEFASMTDDLAPPQYQSLVERYYQVLSREGSERSPKTPTPPSKPAKP
jgi:hypothetical protein